MPSAIITEPRPDFGEDHVNQYGSAFREYSEGTSKHRPSVVENYRMNHKYQTHVFAVSEKERWCRFNTCQMGIWQAMELLNEVVDDSDPDTALPQIAHLFQTAEACRMARPEDDWFHLTGLIHDLGKVLAHQQFGSQPQWAVVGDTFPTGCAYDPKVILYELFEANPDAHDTRFSSPCGVYHQGCGLKEVHMSWGHDEYLYQVLVNHGTNLPPAALFIIRYHSFYALHQGGAYKHLLDAEDIKLLPWLHTFQKCDLYSKTDVQADVAQLKDYYLGLIQKYIPRDGDIRW